MQFVSSLVSDFTPIVLLALCYGFYHARIQHLIDFRYPLILTILVFLVEIITVLMTDLKFEFSVEPIMRVYPFLYLTLLVTDALYRSTFPDRITWKAWHSLRALTNNTVRVGVVMALYAGFLQVGVQVNYIEPLYLSVFPQSPVLTVILSVLIFHALPLLVGNVLIGAPWLLMALFSALVSSGFLLLKMGAVTFSVAVGCSILVSALFWCFGLWPTLIAYLMRDLIISFPNPQLQFYLGGLVLLLLIVMLILQIIFETQYLSIGAYSLRKREPMVLFETLQVGAVPRHFLFLAIGVLGLGLKLSDWSLAQNTRLVPIAYHEAIAKTHEVLRLRGVQVNNQMRTIARMAPLDLFFLEGVREVDANGWQQLIPAFIKWGCWQTLTYQLDKSIVYETLICQNRQWTQVHALHHTINRAVAQNEAKEIAITAIGENVNLLPKQLSLTMSTLKQALPGYPRWQLWYDISGYLASSDIGLNARVDIDGSSSAGVYLDIKPPAMKNEVYWSIWRMGSSVSAIKILLVSSLLIAIYVFGRRVAKLVEPTGINILSCLLIGVFVFVNYQQVINAQTFDWVLDDQQSWLNPVIPIIQVAVYALLLSGMVVGSYHLQQHNPPLSLFSLTVSGAVGSLFWILYVGLAIAKDDLPIELDRLWLFFLPHQGVFPSMMMLYWMLLVSALTFWGRVLVKGGMVLHVCFIITFSLGLSYYAATPTQSAALLMLFFIAYPIWLRLMRLYGLRIIVPCASFPLIYWLSWVLPMARADIKLGAAIVLLSLLSALILVIVQPRKREVLK